MAKNRENRKVGKEVKRYPVLFSFLQISYVSCEEKNGFLDSYKKHHFLK